MGSTGSGRFSDYSGSGKSSSSTGAGGGGGGAGAGGSSGVDQCEQAFSCVLEEVAQCEYYETNGELPDVGSALTIEVDGRVVAVDESGLVVGALPTSYNYVAGCIEEGYEYVGVVSSSSEAPMPSVSVDVMADS